MRAGRMKDRLVLLEPVIGTDGMGGENPVFRERRTVSAERVTMTGRRVDEAGEHFADYRADFNIRDAHPVRENWHVRVPGGYEYIVACVIPHRDRGMLTLKCERLNT